MAPTEELERFADINDLTTPPENLSDIEEGLEKLKEGIEDGNTLSSLLGDWLFNNVSSEKVRVRKTSARVFEDFVADMFGGNVLDEISRDLDMPSKPDEDEGNFVEQWIARNELQKEDVKFPGLDLSVKTLTPTNGELNMGSFAKEALFYDIKDEYGSERTDGLGSGPQMTETFQEIQEEGKWEELQERFRNMIRGIYTDDLLIAIKNHDVLEVYLLTAEEFQDLVIEYVEKGPEDCTNFMYRFEGHSLRYRMKPIKDKFDPIEIPLEGEGSRDIEFAKELRNRFFQELLSGMAGTTSDEELKRELNEIENIAMKLSNGDVDYTKTEKAIISDFTQP
jgi:hypothetical protein